MTALPDPAEPASSVKPGATARADDRSPGRRDDAAAGDGARPVDTHADLRASMRRAGLRVGPDGPILRPRGSAVADVVRRALDLVVSAAALIVLAVPLALVLLAVRLESPGLPLFRQQRVGRDGREFDVLKVRTMVQGAERLGAGLAIEAGDARITRLGAFLRSTSIDELPQFVNVLRGDMALVGPRPTVPVQVARYDQRQYERLLVRPGLTGWAQVQGRSTLTWPERIELDRYYVAQRTLALDARILLRTVRVVLRREDVQRDGAAWIDDREV